MKLLIPVIGLLLTATILESQTGKEYQAVFSVDKKNLGIRGSNPFFPLTPGYQLAYKHGNDTETLTVLAQTTMIDGVETRAVEDREMSKGKLVELTLDYYAIYALTNDVYYFGEDVDEYKNGKVVGHEGSWRSGVKGARFGLFMPAKPDRGQRFYQEQAPGVGMDRVEVISVSETITTPAGTFQNCVHLLETSPLEKGLRDNKWYGAGVGQLKDVDMVLVKYGAK